MFMPNWLRRVAQKLVAPKRDNAPQSDDGDLSDAENERQSQIVMLIKAKCALAASILESAQSPDADTDFKAQELKRYAKFRRAVFDHLNELTDEFYRSAGAHDIVSLLTAAGEDDEARRLLRGIEVDFIREKAERQFVGGASAAFQRFQEIRSA